MIQKAHRMLCQADVEKTFGYIRNNFDMDKLTETEKEVVDKCDMCQSI